MGVAETNPGGLILGITGHRALPDDPAFHEAVASAIAERLDAHAGGPVTLLSALAEGADRLVAHLVLARSNARLVALLPLPPADYARDFATAASKAEFSELLNRASETIIMAPQESRTAAYQAVGDATVAGCDLLIALWDGKPARGQGGTGNVVAAAWWAGKAVLWIATTPPYQIRLLEPAKDDAP